MKPVATIILNRNMPKVTDALYEHLARNDGDMTDVYVVESGSDAGNLSRHASFVANWEQALADGLRYPRGFNFGLAKLAEEKKFDSYQNFFLVCNDCIFPDQPSVGPLMETLESRPRLGALSPCLDDWGERQLLDGNGLKYFWHVNHVALMVKKSFIQAVGPEGERNFMNFLYDGNNFRGYESDVEVVAKGYANDFASGITSKVIIRENKELLLRHHQQMKTDDFDHNRQRLLQEGKIWLRNKYGFNSRWTMQMYAKFFYDKFFDFFPEESKFRI